MQKNEYNTIKDNNDDKIIRFINYCGNNIYEEKNIVEKLGFKFSDTTKPSKQIRGTNYNFTESLVYKYNENDPRKETYQYRYKSSD